MKNCGDQKPAASECAARLAAVADALYAIGGKWKLRIIIGLSEGKLRFNELQRMVKGISAKVLSNELKELEMNGFVKRCINTDNSVFVEYELTEYSESLQDVLHALSEWGIKHKEKIRRGMHTLLSSEL